MGARKQVLPSLRSWPSEAGDGGRGLAACGTPHLPLSPCRPTRGLVAAAGGSSRAGAGLLMPGAGKETQLQCSCQESHFIERKEPSPSAQHRVGSRWSLVPELQEWGGGPARPPAPPALSAGAPSRAEGWPRQSFCAGASRNKGRSGLGTGINKLWSENHSLVTGAQGHQPRQICPPRGQTRQAGGVSHEAQKKGRAGADGGGRLGTREKSESKV